jgi:hypothetical protein
MRKLVTSVLATLLVGCGGGGGGDGGRSGSSYSIYAQTPDGFPYSVCIDGIDPPNPNSPQGEQVTGVMMDYFDLVNLREVVVSLELSCVEVDPGVDEVVTLNEYNNIILPTVLGSQAPAMPPLKAKPDA